MSTASLNDNPYVHTILHHNGGNESVRVCLVCASIYSVTDPIKLWTLWPRCRHNEPYVCPPFNCPGLFLPPTLSLSSFRNIIHLSPCHVQCWQQRCWWGGCVNWSRLWFAFNVPSVSESAEGGFLLKPFSSCLLCDPIAKLFFFSLFLFCWWVTSLVDMSPLMA